VIASPRVSVITATYNRAKRAFGTPSNRFSHKLSPIGKCGSWATPARTKPKKPSGNSRILGFTFFNLPQNAGDQSGPNNEGFRRSRGQFIAYLNHDDLWFSGPPLQLHPGTRGDRRRSGMAVDRQNAGPMEYLPGDDLSDQRKYAPHIVVPASFWVLRRELVEEIGPWRHYSECHAAPSQDWLFRAYCAGKDLRYIFAF